MLHQTIVIKEKNSQEYARLVTYLWDRSSEINIEKRGLVLICPGGGYEFTSDREAEAIALKIMGMGYHAAILRYSVAPAEYPTALTEVARCVAVLREHAEEWNIDREKIVTMGFSAGGHLAASYGVFWKEPWLAETIGVETEELRPNGQILCYPVITSDRRFWHEGSFRNLLGSQWNEELLKKMSLEKQIGLQVPRTFIWHTFTDTVVPVENALLMVAALQKNGISTEFHMYDRGVHGLSLANELTNNAEGLMYQEECQSWINLLEVWLKNL